jgi:glutaminyl-tRNA synthetase
MCERTGVTKSDGWIDFSVLEGSLRDDLDPKAPRAIAVLRPLKLIVDNFPQGGSVECSSPVHPHHPELGNRTFPFSRELWIEEEDFMEVPSKGYHRFYPPIGDQPGSRVRLKYGFVVECVGYDKDDSGKVSAVHVKYFEDSKSGTDGANNYKVKGNITWVSAASALAAEVRLFDRLFTDPNPDAGGKDFKAFLNPGAKEVITAYLEPGLANAAPEQRFQFERHGYFVADRVDSKPGKPVFNRITTLKDSWTK